MPSWRGSGTGTTKTSSCASGGAPPGHTHAGDRLYYDDRTWNIHRIEFNEWSVSNLRTELSRHMGHAFFGSTLCQWPTIYEQLTPLAIGELTGTSVLTIELPD
ncbi:uncharacterized protein LOC112891113 [Panicum hallii]|uniref:uncharacterized protein LOC112891113 n=1 Tax=Panicum hallii TaxID=206008 RepID=UPI000DF4D878|nr:uncharacterized protein LOC112891113 [Panicum hallii]